RTSSSPWSAGVATGLWAWSASGSPARPRAQEIHGLSPASGHYSSRSGYRLGLDQLLFLDALGAVGDRLADVPERACAAHVREDVEVVRLGRREGEPLERVAAPGVVPGRWAGIAAEDRVRQGHHDPGDEDEGSDRRDQVVGADAGAAEVLVGVDHLALLAAG